MDFAGFLCTVAVKQQWTSCLYTLFTVENAYLTHCYPLKVIVTEFINIRSIRELHTSQYLQNNYTINIIPVV